MTLRTLSSPVLPAASPESTLDPSLEIEELPDEFLIDDNDDDLSADAARAPSLSLRDVNYVSGQVATPNTKTVADSTPAADGGDYDYIVVGAGAGGAVTGARLAEAGFKVLVLESGGNKRPIETEVPAFHAKASELPEVAMDFGVRHYADDSQQKKDPKFDEALNGVLYPRGEGIGGSTIVNAMFTVLAHYGDWNKIAQLLNDPSWNDENMMKFWTMKIENNQHRPLLRLAHKIGKALGFKSMQNLGKHGFDGYLSVSQPDIKLLMKDPQLQKLVAAAAMKTHERLVAEKGGGAVNHVAVLLDEIHRVMRGLDPNDWRAISQQQEGLSVTPLAIDKTTGKRSGVRDLLLDMQTKHPERLHIKTEALVSRVLFDDKNKATGVELLEGANLYGADDEKASTGTPTKRTLSAKKGVVLAAGAFGTPQLLKLSGVGPKEELEQFGIPVRVDNAHVGENLHDRYEVPVISQVQRDFALTEGATFKADPTDPHFKEWVEKGGGIYASNGSVIGIIKKSDPSLAQPDLYIFGIPAQFPEYYQGYSEDSGKQRNLYTWLILKAKTDNRAGSVKLKSADPRQQPDINFHSFEEGKDKNGNKVSERDLDAMVYGVDFVRLINKGAGDVVVSEVLPGVDTDSRDKIKEWVKKTAWGHHATGTAALGTVVDNRMKVMGTDGLYVVDASIFPDIPGFFIAAPTMMAAEKGASMIIEDGRADEVSAAKGDVIKPSTGGVLGWLKRTFGSG